MAKYEALGNAIEEAVRKACQGKDVGIAFSGGMDSGLLPQGNSDYSAAMAAL